MLKQNTSIRLKGITNNEWITVNKRWIAFAICCLLFALVAMQDSNWISYIFLLHIVNLGTGDPTFNLAPIPTLIMSAVFIASVILAAYNKKIIPAVLSALSILYGCGIITCFDVIPYYGIAIIIANIILIAYVFSKKASVWKIAPIIVAVIGLLIIVVAFVLSFYRFSVLSGTLYKDTGDIFGDTYWDYWGPRQDGCAWWELFGHFYPLEVCNVRILKNNRVPATADFPISTGLMYIVLAIGIGLKKIQLPVSKKNKQTTSGSKVDGYLDMIVHIALCIFVGGVWQFVWIYRTMAYLNQELDEDYTPWKKLLLCIFVPFYSVYWFYVHGKRLDQLTQQKGINKNNIATTCCVVSLFVPVISCVLMQDRINSFYSKTKGNAENNEDKDIAEEIRKLKALLDDGYITQEEFDAKKKQILGL